MESGNELASDFGFGFNDVKFSDRILLIQIIPNSLSKRRRLDLNQDTSFNGDEAFQRNGSTTSTDYSSTPMIRSIHISTIVLAAKSRFFFKLFSNGMAESNQQHVTLQIQESEEAAFMDLLKFMYTNTLSSTTTSDLLEVLMAADKYGVLSCMKYCFQLLQTLPMTLESAFSLLDLPSTILADNMADTAQSLIDDAKEFLVAHFSVISKNQEEEEMLSLPLTSIEAVLSRDDLQVDTEDDIYDFVMKWARRHYTEQGELQDILNTRLLRLIRFQFMSCCKLKELLKCTDINHEHSCELVFDALSFHISR